MTKTYEGDLVGTDLKFAIIVSRFNSFITNKFNNKFGKMTLLNKRYQYSLVGVFADQFVANRFALIGDAAVGMHPVTAHGFNLGLRGQNTLSLQIKFALEHGLDIGLLQTLETYQLKHRRASRPLYLGTNAIVKLYTDDSLLAKITRKIMLRIIIKMLDHNEKPVSGSETLSQIDHFNEAVFNGLRTREGLQLRTIHALETDRNKMNLTILKWKDRLDITCLLYTSDAADE